MKPIAKKQFRLAGLLRYFLLVLSFSSHYNSGFSQTQKQTAVTAKISTYVGGYYESLPVDYTSNTTKKYPLLIFIHGKGEIGDGSEAQLPRVLANGPPKLINQGKFPSSFTVGGKQFSFIVISPQITTNNYTESPTFIDNVINYCKQKYRVDEERIYVTGLSMGGGMTWKYIGTYPERVAAALTVCGSVAYSATAVDNMVSANLPVWATHNSGDPTVSANVTIKWIDKLNAHVPAPAPAPLTNIFDAAGHDAWSKTYDLAFKPNGLNVYEWMLSHKRGSATPLPPIANAGIDQTITLPVNSASLDGTKSTAQSGTLSSYAWSKISGPSGGTVSSANTAKTNVTGLVEGSYQFQLKITDSNGGVATATVTVKVNPAPLPPVANAGTAKSITLPVNSVTLDGTKSTAPSGTITVYQWSQLSGPSSGIIVSPSASTTSVTGLMEGIYSFQLKITDSNGGSSNATVTVTVNAAPIPPVADAGNDQIIYLPVNTVTLDGGNSAAPSGAITSYQWSKSSGPSNENITSPSNSTTSVTGLTEGVYSFQLKVTDNNGAASTASVTITVKAAPLPPVANAGSAQTITLPLNTVTLDGSGSVASSGNSISSYAWTKVSGPSSGSISNAASAGTTVTGLAEGVYSFELTVTDNNGAASTASVTITVNAAPLPPVANAGSAQTITLPLNTVTLDGSGSVASSGNSISSYAWTKVSGPSSGSISNAASAGATVTGLSEGVYKFQLKVTDNNGAASTASVTITVKAAPLPPVANAGSAQTITLPLNTVTLDGSSSVASSGNSISSYEWTKVSGPSAGTISSAANVSTTVTGLAEGVYSFELTVTDNNGAVSTASVTITVKAAPLPPVANAGSAQTITLPLNTVTLDGSGSTASSGNSISSYAWTKVSGPSSGSISNAASAGATVTGLAEGVYSFELTVTDNNGAASTASVTITVKAAPLPPVANAGSAQTITLPVNTVTLDGSGSVASSGNSISSYAWTKVSGPSSGSISNAASAGTTVTGLSEGVYSFELTVTDNNGAASTASVTITVTAAPLPPTADAGADQTISLPVNTVTLDGSGSVASSGNSISSYAWTKVSGPSSGSISNAASAGATVTGLAEGVYSFELTVTDNNGAASTASVTITVNAAPLPPVANAGSAQTITLPLNTVTLDGSGSVASSGNSISSYAWTKVSGPSSGSISNAASAGATVTGLSEGVYKFQLKVTDNNGAASTASVTITVKAAPLPPVANAGSAQTITLPLNTVTLDGSSSVASSGNSISSYEWTKVSGSSAGTISSAANVSTTVTGLAEGVYSFELTVTDNNGAVSTASVTITVKAAPLPPVANAGSAQTITLPLNTVTLDGSGSTASSGNSISSYAWTKVSGPSSGSISNAASAGATVTGLAEGVYSFELTVTDNNGAASTASVTITVKAAPLPPVANAGSAQTITLPVNTVTLDGSGSVASSGNSISSYEWTKVSGPSAGTISSAANVSTTVTGLAEGVYSFELTVTDNNGAASTASVTITVNAAPLPPVANAGSAQTITLPLNTVTLDGSGSTASSGNSISSYAWTKVSGPSSGSISNAASAGTTVTGLAEGVYSFELTVTDNNGAASTASVTITVTAAPLPPVANAGSAQTITLPLNAVTLDGSGSVASSGNSISSYEWTKVSVHRPGTISSAANVSTTVTGLAEGVYSFELTVTDNNGAASTASVTITVNAAPLPPVANAGSAQTITLPLNTVTLDGSGSTASSGNSISSYAWTKVSGPSSGSISNAASVGATVTGLSEGVYSFELTVTDNNGAASTASVTITVNSTPQPPVADAGNDQIVTLPVNSATLDGSESTAPAGSIIKYEWSKLSGPSPGVITNQTEVKCSITGLEEGLYQFQLKVTDNNGAVATSTVFVTVKAAPAPPVANAGNSQTITLPNNIVTLSGSGSSAPAGKITKYAWSKLSGPSGATINLVTNPITTVSGLVAGTYVFQLKVTDDNGNSATASVTVVVNPALVKPPIAEAGADISVQLPADGMQLDGSKSRAMDGTISSYSWEKLSGPGAAVIINSNSATPLVQNIQAGTYTFKLTITDSNGNTASDIVTTLVIDAALVLPPPVADAGETREISLPDNEVFLDAGLSSSQYGTIEKYNWKILSGPSVAIIESPNSDFTSVQGLVAGEYVFELIVTDNLGKEGSTTVKILVKNGGERKDLSPVTKVFPNPVSSFANIEVQGPAKGRTSIDLYDSNGKRILRREFIKDDIYTNHQIDMSRLAKGIYFIEITIDYQYRSVVKIVKL